MSDLPTIAIDEIEDNIDDIPSNLNIMESHTEVEDLDSDNDMKRKILSVLKPIIKSGGSITDIEDFEDSDDNINNVDESNCFGPEISLTEMLDQGCVDEHSNIQGNVKKTKLQGMKSVQKTPSPTAFNLMIRTEDLGGITDFEDIEGSEDEFENEKHYTDDEMAVELEGANIVNVHDSMNRKKPDCKFVSKVIDESLSSSDSEGNKDKPSKSKIKKHYLKRNNRCEQEKSDTENIYFTDDDKKTNNHKSSLIFETPDVEIMAFEGSDNDDMEKNEQIYPEINITFTSENNENRKICKRVTTDKSPILKLPLCQDEATTDVENLNSSEDDENDGKQGSKECMPLALVKSDALTDIEDFVDLEGEEINDNINSPDINLPSPVREFTVLIESKSGEPYKETTPLPENVLLGFDDLDASKGLTDIENFSDESGDEEQEDDHGKYKNDFKFPDIDGGVVESSDHSIVRDSNLRICHTPDPKTDTEDILLKNPEKSQDCRRRRGKNKNHCNKAIKSNFLDTKLYDDGTGSAHTDVEDLQVDEDDIVLKDKNIKQRRATIECSTMKFINGDNKTDIEYLSCGDDIVDDTFHISKNFESINTFVETNILTMAREFIRNKKCVQNNDLNIPLIRRISATPQPTPRGSLTSGTTDIENIQCDSDNDEYVSYSRTQTATPTEINRQLYELSSSEVHDVNKRGNDYIHEKLEIKGSNENVDSHTDIEYLD